MRRCEDVKMRDRPPLLEEPCAQTLSGKKKNIIPSYEIRPKQKGGLVFDMFMTWGYLASHVGVMNVIETAGHGAKVCIICSRVSRSHGHLFRKTTIV
jgi:hypothetical protein